MWHENKYDWFEIEKGNLTKYARQTWKTSHLKDIDQVHNILFLDKVQEELVVLVVLSITST